MGLLVDSPLLDYMIIFMLGKLAFFLSHKLRSSSCLPSFLKNAIFTKVWKFGWLSPKPALLEKFIQQICQVQSARHDDSKGARFWSLKDHIRLFWLLLNYAVKQSKR